MPLMRLIILVDVLFLAACQFPRHAYVPSGEQIYKQYCAACHGPDAKGRGPMASVLTTPPTNLTTLAKRNSGKFPYDYVVSVLEFGPTPSENPKPYIYPAHSSSDMPVWGPIFQHYDQQGEVVVRQRIKDLCDYLASVQQQ